MSEELAGYIKKILFRIKWLTMSDRKKYAYLWNRTRDIL